MAPWADLPGDLLEEILKQVTCQLDVIQFGFVCKSWLTVVSDAYMRIPAQLPLSSCFPQPKHGPILMLPSKDGSEYGRFWSPTECKEVGYLSMPETHGKWLCASSLGWVVMVDFKVPEEVVLFNPITRVQIKLPPLSTFPVHQYKAPEHGDLPRKFFFIQRAALSDDPSKDQNNWILMVVVSHVQRLCYYKPAEDKWTLVDKEHQSDDVVYYQGRFYTVNQFGSLSTVVFGFETPPKIEPVTGKCEWIPGAQKYLVVSSQGELLQVTRTVEYGNNTLYSNLHRSHYTDMVLAHKLLDAGKNVWEELETLGDDILFLGPNASLCFSRQEFPKLKVNSVYLTDDRWRFVEDDNVQCLDLGIFNYEVETLQPLELVDPPHLMRSLWIVPSIL